MKRFMTTLFLVLALLVAGCRSKEPLVLLKPQNDIALARPRTFSPASQPSEPVRSGTVVELDTNYGMVAIALEVEKAPLTVNNFLQYVKDGFYDNTLFHRVIPGFMIQGGGYNLTMEEKPTRASIKNESSNGLRNRRGTVAMARRDPLDSATAQFFINLEDNPFLNADGPYGGYAVFGRVIEGMEVVDKIAAVPTATRKDFENLPQDPVIIRRAYMR